MSGIAVHFHFTIFDHLQAIHMKKTILILPVIALAACSTQQVSTNEEQVIAYPKTKKVDTTDNYHGTKISDPYRWLEDDNSTETAEWVKSENQVTFDYLTKIPFREKIRERLKENWNFEKVSAPFKKGEWVFFYKNDGIQNQSVLYVQEGMNGTPRVLIDPNKESAEGTTALGNTAVSNDKKYMAFSMSQAGSDWSDIQVLDIKTGERLKDKIDWVKFSGIAWKGDGFYYSAYSAPEKGKELSKKNEYHKIFYHKLGDPQSKDMLVFEDKQHPLRNFSADVTEDEKFLLLYGSESTSGNSLAVKDLTKPNASFMTIVDNFENDYSVLDNVGSSLLVMTNKNASRYQLVMIDPANPSPDKWKAMLPEQQDLLQSVNIAKDKIVARYLHDVTSKIKVYDMNGKMLNEVQLPGLGTVGTFNSSKEDDIAFYNYTSFTQPSSIFKYDVNSGKSSLHYQTKMNFKSEEYETKQVFYTSKDGTKIPMFITHKKGIKLDGTNPTFLYGYGGFNISNVPGFAVQNTVFLENGGVYAVANLRGGGEYGEEWHKSGTLCQKQNVFDDFIAAAEYLIKEKYTTSEKLAIHGRSNGGLLVGAVMTQRPDLAKVAIPGVGVLDMLRYQKFTIGWAWATDYGTSDNKEQFDCLIKYSPLHNVKPVSYPATLVVTADHDDRVVPAHSFKFAAALQENQKGTNPVMIRIDTNAGHGAGKPTSKVIDEWADVWSFVFYNLGMKVEGIETPVKD
jgi:prolyl oligopeptidase